MKTSSSKGFAGHLAETFIQSKLTLVIVFTSLFLGILAVYFTPKEEEPQIIVPMIDIQVGIPGFEADEVEQKVTEPIERGLWGIDGVEYVYSVSQSNAALVTVRFKVGENLEASLIKIHHKLSEIQNTLPSKASSPLVKSYSIDDVPFLTLTLSSEKIDDDELRKYAAELARSLSSVPDLNSVSVLGGQKKSIRVIADPEKLKSHGVSLLQVAQALQKNDYKIPVGKNWGGDEIFDLEMGSRLSSVSEILNLAIGQRAGEIVKISDVAQVIEGPEQKRRASLLLKKEGAEKIEKAVSLVFTKRKGSNVVALAEKVLTLFESEKANFPSELHYTLTRNYGETAQAKSNELIEHLLIATLSVSILIALFMGLRAAFVVVVAIPVTLALTLAIYYFLGYTLNRVTLFALIFSIGILVDDAIVVVENIERHLSTKAQGKSVFQAVLDAVSEVGNPTILATFTVIAAILPMAFVRGLMGPYMKPIPVGASLAMIFSLLVAFIVTPWISAKVLKVSVDDSAYSHRESGLDRLYSRFMDALLSSKLKSAGFFLFTTILFLLSSSLLYYKIVKVKMLPFDNKNEFQVLIDFPPQNTLAKSLNQSQILASEILKKEEVKAIQIYIGEAAPFSFSGMVKHVFQRGREDQVDLQIVLKDKDERKASSHQMIEELRPLIASFGKEHQAITKVLEIPPGPPVLATVLAEIYGPTDESRKAAAQKVYEVMKSEPSVVDLDISTRPNRARKQYVFNYSQAGFLGVNSETFSQLGALIFSETPLALLADSHYPENILIELSIKESFRSSDNPLLNQSIPSLESGVLQANAVLKENKLLSSELRYRKNLKPVVYVMSELSGAEEAPVYGMMKITSKISLPQQTTEVPSNTNVTTLKWDGEWFITYEVFRDLGAAFGVVMILIFVLVLGWFKSFRIPLVIMAPIPISLIGIFPGHALTGVYFTATSMIGFIAGAGVIVRNSIILVDFIQQQAPSYPSLKEAVIHAGVLRFRPMLLTAAAVVAGSSIMLKDPIFQGLAVSLIFGEVAATLLSRFAVPILYYWFHYRRKI